MKVIDARFVIEDEVPVDEFLAGVTHGVSVVSSEQVLGATELRNDGFGNMLPVIGTTALGHNLGSEKEAVVSMLARGE